MQYTADLLGTHQFSTWAVTKHSKSHVPLPLCSIALWVELHLIHHFLSSLCSWEDQSLLGLLLKKSNCLESEAYNVALDRTVSQWSLQSMECLSLTSVRVRSKQDLFFKVLVKKFHLKMTERFLPGNLQRIQAELCFQFHNKLRLS